MIQRQPMRYDSIPGAPLDPVGRGDLRGEEEEEEEFIRIHGYYRGTQGALGTSFMTC